MEVDSWDGTSSPSPSCHALAAMADEEGRTFTQNVPGRSWKRGQTALTMDDMMPHLKQQRRGDFFEAMNMDSGVAPSQPVSPVPAPTDIGVEPSSAVAMMVGFDAGARAAAMPAMTFGMLSGRVRM